MPQPQMVTGLPSRMDCALLLVTLMVALTGTVTPQTSSEPCPKRLVGEERRRTCPRPCKADLDCGSKRQCLCDGQCGLSCVAPGRTCPWPLAPREDAVARLLHPTHSFSALLEVRCKPGLTLPSGLDVVIRRCQGDRRWSGDEPICTAVLPEPGSSPPKCPLPKEVTSTFTIEGTATVGTSIRYSCQSGADIVGSAENYCQENQTWQYPHPVCKKVYCKSPGEVPQGYVVAVQKTEYEVGFDIHYLCKKNFHLDGPQKVTCLANGSWSAAPPFCRARCLIPAVRSRVMIDGVKRWPFDITDTMVPHGENVTFFCKHLHKHCSFSVAQSCFDGELRPPACYLEPTWLQFQLFPHRLVSEIETCDAADVETF
ncbi:beta-2-glycoprotein 1-like isoform X2 [Corythoichthys intestinalis]|uniref:beta-2-glycoprotein 1-like isoform X2 n=1 Tax=Corythoichthys intestinalis TaxID=161448 RepID=UPI0025A6571A|nr:beta-2-glycoprotein 1-like isoform X2 [Corythoichthys intestinalis]